jgi:hypothetical protein
MKRSSARKRRMVPDAGKGILLTLIGLALAACGGGSTVAGRTALPGELTDLPEEGLAVLSVAEAREKLGGAGPSGASATSTSSFDRNFGDIPLLSRGGFEINENQLQPNPIIAARVGSAEAHFLLKNGDNTLVKFETNVTAFTSLSDLNLATADHFEFASDLADLIANIGYDPPSYDISGLMQLQLNT